MKPRHWFLVAAAGTAAALVAALLVPPAPKAEAQDKGFLWSYAAKFVCGFNKSNVGYGKPGEIGGEATVKIGNYATEINIYNPNWDTHIQKKLLVLYNDQTHWPPQGREPNIVNVSAFDFIGMGNSQATMDDCNRIYQLLFGGVPPPGPQPLIIGFLVVESQVQLNVTAVYTAELCSDWQNVHPPDFLCHHPEGNYGVGLALDVEEVTGTRIGA